MTLVPAKDTFLGRLSIHEVYFEHDGPRFFVAKNKAGHLYLVNCVDEDEDLKTETYLYAPVSNSRLNLIRSGSIGLRDAFLEAEGGIVYEISAHYGAAQPHNVLEAAEAALIRNDWLPFEDAKLDLPTETLPSFNVASFARASEAEYRTRLAVEVHAPKALRTEYSLRSLSRLGGSLQDALDSLAQEELGRPTTRGMIPDDILQETELVFSGAQAASFVLILAPKSNAGLEGHQLVSRSTERLLDLLDAASSHQNLSELLSQYGNRARSKFRNLLTVLSDDETGASVFIASPSGETRSGSIGLESVRDALIHIDERNPDTERIFLKRVTLVGVNLRTGIFELFDNVAGQRYSGQTTPEAKNDISGLPTGDQFFYSAVILKSMDYSTMTSDVSVSYRLLHISNQDAVASDFKIHTI